MIESPNPSSMRRHLVGSSRISGGWRNNPGTLHQGKWHGNRHRHLHRNRERQSSVMQAELERSAVDLCILTGVLPIRWVTACRLVASFDLGVAIRGTDGTVAELLDAGVLLGEGQG